MVNEDRLLISFWRWFFKGTGARPGYQRLINRAVVFHVLLGLLISFLIKGTLAEIARTTILPLSGVLVGLTFAWAGNAQSVLQTQEIRHLSEYNEGGFYEYIYVYQAAILSVLVSLISWGLLGLNLVDNYFAVADIPNIYFLMKAGFFALTSLAIRECWQAVSSAHALIRIRHEIRKAMDKKQEGNGEKRGTAKI